MRSHGTQKVLSSSTPPQPPASLSSAPHRDQARGQSLEEALMSERRRPAPQHDLVEVEMEREEEEEGEGDEEQTPPITGTMVS